MYFKLIFLKTIKVCKRLIFLNPVTFTTQFLQKWNFVFTLRNSGPAKLKLGVARPVHIPKYAVAAEVRVK